MEKLMYQARWLKPEGEPDSVVPHPLDTSKKLARGALRYYEDGGKLIRDAIRGLRVTTGLDSPQFKVKAKWTAVGGSEMVDFAPSDERCGCDLEEEPNEEEMMELQLNNNQSTLDFLEFEQSGEEGDGDGGDEGGE